MLNIATHPGEVLAEELTELNITATELARQIQVPPNRISQLLAGKRSLSSDTALRLAHWFGNSAQFWMNLQTQFDLAEAKRTSGHEIAKLASIAS